MDTDQLTGQGDKKTALYRHFDEDKNLLYVGISLDAVNRTKDHKRGSRWFDRVSNVQIENFPTRAAALEAEYRAIKAEKPLHNKTHGDLQPSDMTPTQFRAIRQELGLSQAALARVLGYGSPMRISEFERATNPRDVPHHVAMLMRAFASGYRTKDWPNGKIKEPKRPIRIEGGIAYIPLTRGYTAMVDAEDANLVSAYNWSANVHGDRVYAVANIGGRFTHLRQLIAKPASGRYVRSTENPLDCRKASLGITHIRKRREHRADAPVRPRGRPPKHAKLVPRNPDFEIGSGRRGVASGL